VVGQLLPGMVSLLLPQDAAAAAVAVPYLVFAGNVGHDGSLADVVEVLRGTPQRPGGRPAATQLPPDAGPALPSRDR
jgi:hypothetical protein